MDVGLIYIFHDIHRFPMQSFQSDCSVPLQIVITAMMVVCLGGCVFCLFCFCLPCCLLQFELFKKLVCMYFILD